MRYLNRIIFINSAQIKYAEINLDGNVHFIGTQGVGKSTLLRAILFFYNADTLGLGIPRQKASYVDYYFNHSNSYIIYEVVREEGKFCVVSYKSQHKVCFRFFDGEYQELYFVNEQGDVPDNWDGIAWRLDANKIFYTKRKIDEYKDYRDIIYGNNDGKKSELRRYSLLESKEYQQVPKTIQNVFLNSKMEAEFIKQIIILSLDNDRRIDLERHAHNLNKFDTQLADIRKFKFPSTSLQAENISKLHSNIRCLEREKIQLARELAYAVNENERKEPELTKKLDVLLEKEKVFEAKLYHIKDIFEEKQKRIIDDIRIQDYNLRKAKEKREDYERKNIEQIIAKVGKKNDFEKEQGNLQSEKALLSVQFADLELKFKMRFDALENQHKDFLNRKDVEKNEINAEFLVFKENITKNFDKQVANFKNEYKTEINLVRSDWESQKLVVGNLKVKKGKIELTRFFEKDIFDLEKEEHELNNMMKQLPIEKDALIKQIETIQKQWDIDERNLQRDFDLNRERIEEQIAEARDKITEIESYINNSKDSLYGWLTEHYPNWEQTIGKVIDDKNVLFNSSLHPRLIEKFGNFYGIEINLSEIDKTVKTINDYKTEKSELDAQIQSLRQAHSDLSVELENDKEKLKKKYQPKGKEFKENIHEIEYSLEQSRTKYRNIKVKLNNLREKAQEERNAQLDNIGIEIDKAMAKAKDTESKINHLEEEQNKAIAAKEKEKDKIIENERKRIDLLINGIEAEIRAKNAENEQQKNEIRNQKNQEFSERGADTKRLAEIENKLQLLNADLKFIDDNRDLVADYRKDKREYIDRINDFKQEKQKLDKQLELEKQKYEKQKNDMTNELSEVKAIIEELRSKLAIIKEDNDCFAVFKTIDLFKIISEYFSNEMQTEKRVKNLIDEIKSIHYEKLNNRKNELRRIATEFLGKFSEDNIFKFKKQIADDIELLSFAEMLSDFVEEQKIEQIEKEVNERFALIVSTIGKETSDLQAESGKIQSVIAKINNDFMEKNFVGVIKRIELKIEDSKNEIVQLLLDIKKYNDENAMEFGSPNLFSSDNQEKKNREAVDLLKQFVKKINELKKDNISLADSFELKFRIEENQNNTGWVEKLSNVGSEGTDTLVKAMVNIMLLNVFKESVSKKFKDFKLHCMMDEIGKLHPNNVRGILKFANERNILLINGSPIENDALAFKHIYKLQKDERSITKVKRLITQYSEE
jgi:hypothetical protein